MQDTTAEITLPSLVELFATIPDQRKPKGIRYALPPLLVLLSLAKFCQQETPAAITDWVSHRADLWRDKLSLSWSSMPSASTWQRLLGRDIPAETLDEKLGAYFAALSSSEQSCYNLDGKVLRGTRVGKDETRLHLLALQESTTNAVIEQVELLPGENEISAAQRLLERIPLQNKVITGDAIFAQRSLSRLIVERGGDYLWKLRGNQGGLYKAAQAHFAQGGDRFVERASSREKGHGRLDERELATSFRLAASLDFPHLEQVFRLERKSEESKSGKLSEQTIYGLTSCGVERMGASELLGVTRGHWSIENGLHYRRDVTFQEDACRQTTKNGGRVQAVFNNLTIGVLRKLGWENIAKARRYFEAHLDEALRLVQTPLSLLL